MFHTAAFLLADALKNLAKKPFLAD